MMLSPLRLAQARELWYIRLHDRCRSQDLPPCNLSHSARQGGHQYACTSTRLVYGRNYDLECTGGSRTFTMCITVIFLVSDSIPLQAAHAIFRLYEPRIVPLLVGLSTIFLGLFTFCLFETRSASRSFLLTSSALASFATCLYTSMIGYRVFFSPLQHFPGPTLAAISKFWYLYHSTKGNMPQVMRSLNQQYGEIVRIGPNELTIFSLDAMESILGSKGKMTKGPWCGLIAFSRFFSHPYHKQQVR